MLQLYRKQKPTRDMSEIVLRPWQRQVKSLIETPTDREVIWVKGAKETKEKTWLQDYLAVLYGYDRVVQLDLKLKTTDIFNVLKNKPTCIADIFLFNERLALNNESCNYTVLEAIKDGKAISSKYKCDRMQFKIPNIVIFSNRNPNTRDLSKD